MSPFRITFPVEDLQDRELAKAQLSVLVDALASVNLCEMSANHGFPTLDAARVGLTDARSALLPKNQEEWKDAPTALASGLISPPSAVAWRVAELRAKGIQAEPDVLDDGRLLRFVVKMPGGQIEDVAPSAGRPVFQRMRISFLLDLFKSKAQEALSHKCLASLLQAVTMLDVLYLKTHPNTPKIYESGVRYREEPTGAEDWQDVPTCLRRKFSDCDDLACWRAAELIVQGESAKPDFEIQRMGERVLYHIVTRTARGTEDPSYIMGMR